MKNILIKIIPPIFIDGFRLISSKKYGHIGNYDSWEDAKNQSVGYETDDIIEKVKTALLKVKNGEAVYERDSVLFDEVEYFWPVLSGLMLVAAKSNGKLSVLDFGGSLGSTYFQNKKFLDQLGDVLWNIVEQKHYVDVGKDYFEDDKLKFYHTVDDCKKNGKPDVLLLSSVLQYLENPYGMIKEFLSHDFDYILMDRTIFGKSLKNDKITVQHIKLENYSSIPCWVFAEEKMKKTFLSKYELIEDFSSLEEISSLTYEKGFIWKKK